MTKRILTSIIAILFSINLATADVLGNIGFSHISIKEGLSQSTVFAIAQDKTSCMWFATYDGLNKFNGYNFTVYRHDPLNNNSIGSDIIRSLFVDSQEKLWIGTRTGLSLYNSEKETFKNYSPKKMDKKNYQINAISEFDSNRLLLATPEHLILFDTQSETFVPVPGMENNQFAAYNFLQTSDKLWIALNDGLLIYDKKNKTIKPIEALKGLFIQSILQDSDQKIWVATEGAGLFMIDEKHDIIETFRHSKTNPNTISSDYIRSLALDNKGRLWIGTFEGLNIYDKQLNNFRQYTNNPTDEVSISQNSIRSIYKDNQGGMWCGTYFGGLNYYHSLNNRFAHWKSIPYQNTLNDNVISCIVEDTDHNLWIGTNDKGVNFYNTKTNKFTYYMNSQNSNLGIESNNVKTIFVDNTSNLVYIGTHAGGLNILNKLTGRIEHLNTKNSAIISDNVYSIIKTEDDFLWIATLKGLMRYYPQTKTFSTEIDALNEISISQIVEDSKKRLWIGTENGVIVYSSRTKKLIPIEIINNNRILRSAFINCIFENQKGEICIGTRSGLYIYSEKDKSLQEYTTDNGLPSNVVYGILEDSSNRLWMSTNRGLVCYVPHSQKLRTYHSSDGIQSEQFNSYSYCKTYDGYMLFGGINGITVFKPEKLVDNPYTPSVSINKLLLFNKVVMPDDETGILSSSISKAKEIVLNSEQTSFSLEFVVSNYISGRNNTFAYQLEGFDKNWINITDNDSRTITYTNLDHGTYILKVKVANNDGKWSTKITELKITVLPVWWKTWWAILLFSILIVAIAVIVTRFIWFRKLLKEDLRMEQIDKVRQEEMNQMKTRFFINLSHELRTPLTLIQSPLQEIMGRNENDKWLQTQLQYIKKNTSKLMHIINQLMDYRRAELGVFELKVIEGDFNNFVYENFLLYEGFAKRKKIDFSFDSEIIDQQVIFSPQYIELMLSNLISNAFKFTPEGGAITVRLRRIEQDIELTIEDNGKGIPKELHEKIFDRFYQVSPDHTGSGIGLSLVKNLVDMHHGRITLTGEEGEGACFKIYIPQAKSTYSENDFSGDKGIKPTRHGKTLEEMSYSEDLYYPSEKTTDKEKKGTLLIVEDNVEISDYLRTELQAEYDIICVDDGIPALNVLKEKEIDLVLTDVMLGEMDGVKLCKSIKQNIRTCHIPVIMLSAKADIEDQIKGLQVGADDYIPKPFSISILYSKIQNILRSRKIIQGHYSDSAEINPEKITFNVLDEELIRKASEIVRNNMDNIDFSAEEFSKEMAMSRSNLHLKLKAITGESTIEFIRKIRFSEACRLLKEGRYNVSEISVMVGFNSPSYFATSFKKYVGVLPTEYAKSLKK